MSNTLCAKLAALGRYPQDVQYLISTLLAMEFSFLLWLPWGPSWHKGAGLSSSWGARDGLVPGLAWLAERLAEGEDIAVGVGDAELAAPAEIMHLLDDDGAARLEFLEQRLHIVHQHV